jgi:hypothetical protein
MMIAKIIETCWLLICDATCFKHVHLLVLVNKFKHSWYPFLHTLNKLFQNLISASCVLYLPSAHSCQAVTNTESVEELLLSKHISRFVCDDVYTDFVSSVWTIVQIHNIFRTDIQWAYYSIVRIFGIFMRCFMEKFSRAFTAHVKNCTGLEKN